MIHYKNTPILQRCIDQNSGADKVRRNQNRAAWQTIALPLDTCGPFLYREEGAMQSRAIRSASADRHSRATVMCQPKC